MSEVCVQIQAPELSLILPARGIEVELPGILRSIKEQMDAAAAEWIVVDMGSEDQTVLCTVQYVKEGRLQGFVIQDGEGSVSAALNTGMQKTVGEYLSFVSIRRLYGGHPSSYLETARAAQVGLVFDSLDANAEQLKGKPAGSSDPQYVRQMAQGRLRIDIAALLLRKGFLQAQKLYLRENCSHGYSKEFIYCCLLSDAKVARAPVALKRRYKLEPWRVESTPAGREVFQAIGTVLRAQVVIENRCSGNRELCESSEKRKLSEVVMDCVDVLLCEGFGYNTVYEYLRVEGHDRLPVQGERTGGVLWDRVQL